MQTPDAISTLWTAVFGAPGQPGHSERIGVVEANTDANTGRLDRMNKKLDKVMMLIVGSAISAILGMGTIILQNME